MIRLYRNNDIHRLINMILVNDIRHFVDLNASFLACNFRLPTIVDYVDTFAGSKAQKECGYGQALSGSKQCRNALRVIKIK